MTSDHSAFVCSLLDGGTLGNKPQVLREAGNMSYCILSRSDYVDVRQLDEADLEEVYLKTQADIGSSGCQIHKLKRMTKPSQDVLDKIEELQEKLDVLFKDDETILKVRKSELISHNYLKPKIHSVYPKVTTNAQSAILISDLSQSVEVAPAADVDENQTLPAGKRRFDDDNDSPNSIPFEEKNFTIVQFKKVKSTVIHPLLIMSYLWKYQVVKLPFKLRKIQKFPHSKLSLQITGEISLLELNA